ncbi:MAG: hypothetical protein BJ554DRAFT_528 [Olpidium bornovanus]|uniref:Uncharacterized protein n=1 Tax=Olpidium bornovanus TaxID=278681 RepID=A0A8H8DIH7_9FUNG|nr:MAG: hypothetical protein BJ554DRAFT_528 [Olpidium bornovanus]
MPLFPPLDGGAHRSDRGRKPALGMRIKKKTTPAALMGLHPCSTPETDPSARVPLRSLRAACVASHQFLARAPCSPLVSSPHFPPRPFLSLGRLFPPPTPSGAVPHSPLSRRGATLPRSLCCSHLDPRRAAVPQPVELPRLPILLGLPEQLLPIELGLLDASEADVPLLLERPVEERHGERAEAGRRVACPARAERRARESRLETSSLSVWSVSLGFRRPPARPPLPLSLTPSLPLLPSPAAHNAQAQAHSAQAQAQALTHRHTRTGTHAQAHTHALTLALTHALTLARTNITPSLEISSETRRSRTGWVCVCRGAVIPAPRPRFPPPIWPRRIRVRRSRARQASHTPQRGDYPLVCACLISRVTSLANFHLINSTRLHLELTVCFETKRVHGHVLHHMVAAQDGVAEIRMDTRYVEINDCSLIVDGKVKALQVSVPYVGAGPVRRSAPREAADATSNAVHGGPAQGTFRLCSAHRAAQFAEGRIGGHHKG